MPFIPTAYFTPVEITNSSSRPTSTASLYNKCIAIKMISKNAIIGGPNNGRVKGLVES